MRIVSRYDSERVLFEDASPTMRETVIAAVKSGANLTGADLTRAYLTGAYLSGASGGILTASCQWTDHGECGRQLLAVYLPAFAAEGDKPARESSLLYHCGCFHGTEAELRRYIADHDGTHAASRTLALDFCAARMAEMLKNK